MPYLINPSVAAMAIVAKCGNGVGPDDAGLLAILGFLLPRVEDAMNVASLTYGETTDTFQIAAPYRCDARRPVHLRLSNGYLTNSEDAPITITDPNGDVVDAADFTVDLRYGVITLTTWLAGTYTVSSFGGFTVPEVDPEAPDATLVFEDVPKWIEGLVVVLLSQWYRTIPKAVVVPESVAYGELVAPLYREVMVRVQERYVRPRALMLFPTNSVRADGMRT